MACVALRKTVGSWTRKLQPRADRKKKPTFPLKEEAVIFVKCHRDVRRTLVELQRGTYQNASKLEICIGPKKCWKLPIVEKLVQQLGRLPNLQDVTFSKMQINGITYNCSLSIQALKNLLETTTTLRHIQFRDVYFEHGTKEDVWNLVCHQHDLETLEITCCYDYTIQGIFEIANFHLKPLLHALAEATTTTTTCLKHLIIHDPNCWKEWEHLKTILCNCQQLQHLELVCYHQEGYNTDSVVFCRIANILQQQLPDLLSLKIGPINFRRQRHESSSAAASDALVALLNDPNNSNLQELELIPTFCSTAPGSNRHDDEEVAQQQQFLIHTIPGALRRNRTLKRCHIRPVRRHSNPTRMTIPDVNKVYEAWLQVLRDDDNNQVLEEWTLQYDGEEDSNMPLLYPTQDQNLLQHYLRLNQVGYQRLQQEELTQEQWIDNVLTHPSAIDDLSCLYDILHIYPGIIIKALSRNDTL